MEIQHQAGGTGWTGAAQEFLRGAKRLDRKSGRSDHALGAATQGGVIIDDDYNRLSFTRESVSTARCPRSIAPWAHLLAWLLAVTPAHSVVTFMNLQSASQNHNPQIIKNQPIH